MKKLTLLLPLAFIAGIYSCKKESEVKSTGGSTVYLDLPSATAKYYDDAADEANKKATLGRVLFYDKAMSINSSIACASCHHQPAAFADNVRFSRGFEGRETRRNSMAIQNINNFGIFGGPVNGFGGSFFWDGREINLKNLVSRPITNHVEMGISDMEMLPGKLAELPYYKDLFKSAYGDEEITVDRIGEAVSMFMGAIKSENTRFDRQMRGLGDLTALELQGQMLFNTKYECNSCHNLFIGGYTGTEFMNIGLEYPNTDNGAGAIRHDPSWNGKFKIPNLRNVALTAPYMHDGRFATLNDVLDHYSHGIQEDPNLDQRLRVNKQPGAEPIRMNISDQEKQAIVAFLNTLTDNTMITDDKFSNPFKVR